MYNNCDKENGLCINTNGSYHCSCNMGYSGNGINCTGKQPKIKKSCHYVVYVNKGLLPSCYTIDSTLKTLVIGALFKLSMKIMLYLIWDMLLFSCRY